MNYGQGVAGHLECSGFHCYDWEFSNNFLVGLRRKTKHMRSMCLEMDVVEMRSADLTGQSGFDRSFED